MRNFFRTIPGKTLLFMVCILSLCALMASIVGVAFMVDFDFYTKDKETVYSELVYDRLGRDMYDDVWSVVNSYKGKVVEIEDSDIPFTLSDSEDKVIGMSAGAGNISNWAYSIIYGVQRNKEGTVTHIFYSSSLSDEDVEYYIMKASIPTVSAEESGAASGDASFYSIVKAALDKAYPLRYAVFFVGFLALVLAISSFIALMCAAGRHPEDDGLYPGPLSRIPFDGLVALIIFFIVLWALMLDAFVFDDLILVVIVCMGLFGFLNLMLGLAMSFAVRVKQHNLIKGSIIYFVLRYVWRFVKKLWGGFLFVIKSTIGAIKRIPLIWKTALGILIVCIYELIFFSNWDWWAPAWVVEKLVLIPLIIYVALTLRALQKGGEALAGGDLSHTIDTKRMILDFKAHGENLNSVGKGMTIAVNDQLKSERMKTELITNVSHDIKTPLTSIINYADLISKEETNNEKIHEYSDVLLRQSERLKRLIDDLVEASKASTGNLDVSLFPCDAAMFVKQAVGEYQDRIKESGLTLVTDVPDKDLRIMADGRRMWRIFDNLMNNICKYAQRNTRVYLSLEEVDGKAVFTFKNTSREQLNISEEELMERFTRGDSSRNTDGNGLGLSIAKSMAELQNGSLRLSIDGDLFKAILSFQTV